MTAFMIILTAASLGVQSGWAPVERDDQQAEAKQPEAKQPGAYEYILRVTDADLEAIRSGNAKELRSYLPADVGPFDRVRIVYGGDAPPRELTAVDARSPKRLAQAADPQRYEVSKPVVPATWESLPAEDGEDAGPRTAYQNPNTMGFDQLQNGFREATDPLVNAGQEATRRTGEGLQRLGRDTQEFFEQSGDNLRRATENTLNQTGDALESLLPPSSRSQQPNAYGDPRVVAPAYQGRPTPAAAPVDNNARTAADWDSPAKSFGTNTGSFPAAASPRNEFNDPRSNPAGNPGPRFPEAGGDSTSGLSKSFGNNAPGAFETPREDRFPATEFNRYEPAPRGQLNPVRRPDTFAETNSYDRRQDFWPETPRSEDSRLAQDNRSAWPSNETQTGFTTQRPEFDTAPRQAQQNPSDSSGASPTGWNDDPQKFAADDQQNQQQATQQTAGPTASDMWDKLLLVGLGGLNVYLWLSYIDTRHKYRSALRRTSGSFDHSLAA